MVGIQGSLLSIFVEPVYFSSIILGSLYHGDHLSRAMYQRISNIEALPPLYSLNKPLLSGKYLGSPSPRCMDLALPRPSLRDKAAGSCSVAAGSGSGLGRTLLPVGALPVG